MFTQPFSTERGVKAPDEKDMLNLVKSALARDLRVGGKLNIVFEEIYRTKLLDTAYGGGGNGLELKRMETV